MTKSKQTTKICVREMFEHLLEYDESVVGCLKYKIDSKGKNKSSRLAGDRAGGLCARTGYCHVIINGVNYRVHRIVWALLYGEAPQNLFIDHINQNRSDNRAINLRLVERNLNNRNVRMSKNNTSGVTGVTLTKSGTRYYYTARAHVNGRGKYKHFSIKKLGEKEAFIMACKAREQFILELNQHGAGYTDTHGLEKIND